MNKIRVLQFPISMNGGIKAYATNNWKYLNKDKFHCDFAVIKKFPYLGWDDEIRQSGAGIKELFESPDCDRELYMEKASGMLDGNYDVVHLHTSSWKRLLIEEIALACKIPKIIVHSHNSGPNVIDDEGARKAYELHMKIRAQFHTGLATDFCACSRAAADWLFGEQIPRERIRIMKNAIEVEPYLYNREIRDQYRRDLNLDGCFVMGSVGRLSYQKNQAFLLEVFRKVGERVPNARLLLVGEGPLEQELKEQARQLHLENRIIFAGQRNDVPQLLQAMDLFCLPSRFEGLPIVLVEAQAAGLKCLASDQIVDEVSITPNVTRLALDYELWKNAALDVSQGYPRQNMYDTITDAGYNLKFQIHELEDLYSF